MFPAPFPFTPLALSKHVADMFAAAESPAKARFLRGPEAPVPLLHSCQLSELAGGLPDSYAVDEPRKHFRNIKKQKKF